MELSLLFSKSRFFFIYLFFLSFGKIKKVIPFGRFRKESLLFFIGVGLILLQGIIKDGYLARANLYILGFGLAKSIVINEIYLFKIIIQLAEITATEALTARKINLAIFGLFFLNSIFLLIFTSDTGIVKYLRILLLLVSIIGKKLILKPK